MTAHNIALFCDSFLPWWREDLAHELSHLSSYTPHIFARTVTQDSPSVANLFPLTKSRHSATAPALAYSSYAPLSPKILRTLEGIGVSLLHAHGAPTGIYAAQYAARLEVPLVVTLHGEDVTGLLSHSPYDTHLNSYRAGIDALLDSQCTFLYHTPELMELAREAGFPTQRFLEHFRGVDLERRGFQIDMERFSPRSRDAIIVMSGRFEPHFGFSIGVRAFAKLAKSYRVHLAILGEGEGRGALQEEARALGLEDRVSFFPPRGPQAQAALQRACAAMVPSVVGLDQRRDFRGRFAMEAAATGIPVVATTHGANGEIVEDGVTGYLIGERNVDALVDRVAHLLDSPDQAAEFAKAGRAKMEFQFALKKTTNTLQAIYRVVEEAHGEG